MGGLFFLRFRSFRVGVYVENVEKEHRSLSLSIYLSILLQFIINHRKYRGAKKKTWN